MKATVSAATGGALAAFVHRSGALVDIGIPVSYLSHRPLFGKKISYKVRKQVVGIV